VEGETVNLKAENVPAPAMVKIYLAIRVDDSICRVKHESISPFEVQKGDLIRKGQVIGTLYTDSNAQDGELEMVLSDENRRQYDPEKWFDWSSP
jgi:hypothetical protein